jgi:hypothetical protein
MLSELLNASPYGHPDRGLEWPPATYGVYLFTEDARNLYVGRTGRTERAEATGGGVSNFKQRFQWHYAADSGKANFAWRMAVKEAAAGDTSVPARQAWRDTAFEPIFRAQLERVKQMEFRILELEADDVLTSHLLEFYAHIHLETPFNSFATS